MTKEEFEKIAVKTLKTFQHNCAFNIKTDNDDYLYVVDTDDLEILISGLSKDLGLK